MKFPHRKVSKHAAMNPVARALAWRDLQRYAVDAKIKLFMMDEGEECEQWALPVARLFDMVLVGVEYDKAEAEYRFDCEIIAQGQKAFIIISQHEWKFLQGWAPRIAAAIDAAVRLTPKLTAKAVNYAWQRTH
jgi:hypothetical protein